MEQENHDSLPPAELRKRKREGFIVAFSLLLIIFLTATEIHLSKLSSEVAMGNNIIIFGIIGTLSDSSSTAAPI